MKDFPNLMSAEDVEETLRRGCGVPGCEHGDVHDKLILVQRCCPGAGMRVTIYSASKTPVDVPMLRVQCKQCDKDVAGFIIGKEER